MNAAMQKNPDVTISPVVARGDRVSNSEIPNSSPINCEDSFGEGSLAELVKLIEDATGRKCLSISYLAG